MNERPILIITKRSSSLYRRLIIKTLAMKPENGIAVIRTFGNKRKLSSSTMNAGWPFSVTISIIFSAWFNNSIPEIIKQKKANGPISCLNKYLSSFVTITSLYQYITYIIHNVLFYRIIVNCTLVSDLCIGFNVLTNSRKLL